MSDQEANSLQTGEQLLNVEVHDPVGGEIKDLQWSADRTYCITASKDKSAKVKQIQALMVEGHS